MTHTIDSELVIGFIQQRCNNTDDLCKIAAAVESLQEALEERAPEKFVPTLKQMLVQSSCEETKILGL